MLLLPLCHRIGGKLVSSALLGRLSMQDLGYELRRMGERRSSADFLHGLEDLGGHARPVDFVSQNRVSDEELAAKVGGRVGEALDLRRMRVDFEQLEAPFELAAHPKRP